MEPACPYCDKPAEYVATSHHLYSGRDFGPVWQCLGCSAWVGCHKPGKNHTGPARALGRLADGHLRRAKREAHEAFDDLWKRKARRDGCSAAEARGKGYAWLAEVLGIERGACHIGEMDVDQCKRVVEVCLHPPPRAPKTENPPPA